MKRDAFFRARFWWVSLAVAAVALGCDDSATKRVSGGGDDGGSSDASSDATLDASSGPAPGTLISDLDDVIVEELCENAKASRLELRPGTTKLIEIACVAMQIDEVPPESLEECEEVRDTCIADADGVLPEGVEVAWEYQLDCEGWAVYDGAATIGQLESCWTALEAELMHLKETLNCEDVLADPVGSTFSEPPACTALMMVDP